MQEAAAEAHWDHGMHSLESSDKNGTLESELHACRHRGSIIIESGKRCDLIDLKTGTFNLPPFRNS